MTPHALVFDLDGTLLDTLADIAAAVNRVLAANALPTHPVEYFRTRVGWGLGNLLRTCVPADVASDEQRARRLVAQVMEAYAEEPVVHTVPYPGIPELVGALRDAGLSMAVLSNKADELVQRIVRELFPTAPFRAVMGARADRPHKPDPTTTLELVQTMHAQPERTLFVGDSEVDMQTARNAGLVPVGVSWGFRDPETVRAGGARFMCHSVDELSELFVQLGIKIQKNEVFI